MFMVLVRYMMPSCTRGIVWFEPPSFIDQDQASVSCPTLSVVICDSGL